MYAVRNVSRNDAPSAKLAPLGQRHDLRAVDGRELRVAAAPGRHRHDARPVLELAGDLRAEHDRQLRHLRIAAAADEDVDEVDPRGADAHDDLAVRVRIGNVDELERPVDLAQQRGSQLVGAGSRRELLAQRRLAELADARLRDLGDELDPLGQPPLREARREELAQLVGGRRRAVLAARPPRAAARAHFSSGIAITAASATAGCAMSAFSSSTDEIHSPPDLITSFERSLIWM